jgi:hypothetical protein
VAAADDSANAAATEQMQCVFMGHLKSSARL